MIEMHVFGTDTGKWIARALDVVAQYDKATYDRMQAADWWVTSDPEARTDPASDQWVMSRMGPGANAVTISPWQTHYEGNWYGINGKPLSRPYTLVDMFTVTLDAGRSRLDATAFLAGILVHEFQHTQATNHFEAGAYDASGEFYAKLPGHLGKALVKDNRKHQEFDAQQRAMFAS